MPESAPMSPHEPPVPRCRVNHLPHPAALKGELHQRLDAKGTNLGLCPPSRTMPGAVVGHQLVETARQVPDLPNPVIGEHPGLTGQTMDPREPEGGLGALPPPELLSGGVVGDLVDAGAV